MNRENNPSNKYYSILLYPIRKLKQLRNKKQLNLFWNKLSRKDRVRVILIIGINKKPVPSLTHLKAELALAKFFYKEKWSYGDIA
jgi:hypothetical protein